MNTEYLWGKLPLVELTLELYFSVLVVDEDAEWPAVLRGERVVDKEEEAWRAMSLSMLDKVDLLLLSPEEKPPAWEIDQLNPSEYPDVMLASFFT